MGMNTVMDSSYPEGKTNAVYILLKRHFFQEVGIPLLEVIIANSNHDYRVRIVLNAFTALSFVTEPITHLTLPAAVEHLLAIRATQRSGLATATACPFHDEDKPGGKQTGHTMFHRIVKREKIPIMIRTDPRLFNSHTTDVIFSVFWYAFNRYTRIKNQLAMPDVAPIPHTSAYRLLYSIK